MKTRIKLDTDGFVSNNGYPIGTWELTSGKQYIFRRGSTMLTAWYKGPFVKKIAEFVDSTESDNLGKN